MTPEDVQKYLKKSGDDKVITENLTENEHGFMSWTIYEEDTFLVYNVYGDGKYWDSYMNQLAKKLGLKRILISTKRSPRAYMKKYNFNLTGYILEKGVK
tara:strand:- start:669 stop:965 length:297 start_codon:yes stop_codon:yes gene_type:complete